ncbi:MAG TPA: hypothetical protein PKA27_01590 [Fimbriimonadaceae bacterium]|nr:hypothetical protein [Fimbriimonadaceae bacterium]
MRLLLTWVAALGGVHACLGQTGSNYLYQVEHLDRLGLITTFGATKSVSQGAVTMEFLGSVLYPTVYFKVPSTRGTGNQDRGHRWSNFTAFAFTVENPMPYPVEFRLRVDSRNNPNFSGSGYRDYQTAFGTIDAFQKRTYAFHCNFNPSDFGMIGLPGMQGLNWLSYNRAENADVRRENVVRWVLFIDQPSETVTLKFSSPRLLKFPIDLEGISDQFGQYVHEDWPGKVYSEGELVAKETEEGVDLATNPGPLFRTSFGGDNIATKRFPTFRFRLGQSPSGWNFIDPTGAPYFALGLDAVNPGDYTVVQGRESMFVGLPEPSTELGQFYSTYNNKTTFSHYRANLFRRFGNDWLNVGDQRAIQRLRSWGFNLIGNFTETRMWDFDAMPFVVGLANEPVPGGYVCPTFTVDPGRKKMADVFDPQFDLMLAQQAERVPTTAISNPYALGWYFDNEPTFLGPTSGGSPETEEGGRYAIAYAVLKRPASLWPCKQVFVADMQAKYSTIAALNAAWGTGYADWATFSNAVFPVAPSPAARKEDFKTYIRKFARTYFSKAKAAIQSQDGKALFLGCRFFRYSPEVIEAAAEVVDVISLNIYANEVPASLATQYAYLNRPFMVSEFHFGSTDRGMFHGGLVAKLTQQDRAEAFRAYMMSVLQNPLFVGATYHLYFDSPLTGRKVDGENYGVGFVSGTGIPYSEMVEAARDIGYNLYNLR